MTYKYIHKLTKHRLLLSKSIWKSQSKLEIIKVWGFRNKYRWNWRNENMVQKFSHLKGETNILYRIITCKVRYLQLMKTPNSKLEYCERFSYL